MSSAMHSRASVAITASFVALSCTLPTVAQLTRIDYEDYDNYDYLVEGMPDFDQRRLGALPNDGACFCGPAVAANLLATFSANGLPELDPGEPEGTGWHDQANYDHISEFLLSIGNGLGEDFSPGGLPDGRCGVSPRYLAEYLAWRYGADLTVRTSWSELSYGSGGHQEVRLGWLGLLGHLEGALGMVDRRTYSGEWDDFTFAAQEKIGGHYHAVTRMEFLDGDGRFWSSNPWTVEVDQIQSPPGRTYQYIHDVAFRLNGREVDMEQIHSGWVDEEDGLDRIRVLAGIIAIAPKGAHTWSPLDALELCVDFSQPGIATWHPNLAATRRICLDVSLEPIITGIDEIRTTPEGSDLAALIDGRIEVVSRRDGTRRATSLDELLGEAITDFQIDETGRLHVAAGKAYATFDWFSIDLGDEEPNWIVGAGETIGSLAHDRGRTFCLLPESGTIKRYVDRASGLEETTLVLPAGVEVDQESRLHAMGDRLFILSNESVSSLLIEEGTLSIDVHSRPEAPVSDLSVDDNDAICFVLREAAGYRCEVWHFDAAGAFLPHEAHVLDGQAVSERLVVERSRVGTPVDPNDQITGWPDGGPEGVAECPADFDADGDVDGSDLAALLGSWGAVTGGVDLDGDGVVGGSDLAILLGSWGSCQ